MTLSKKTKIERIGEWFNKPDVFDEYFRTGFVQWRDKFFGVERYQLDQRYGRKVHTVVLKTETRDWVDDFSDDLDAAIAKLPWMKT